MSDWQVWRVTYPSQSSVLEARAAEAKAAATSIFTMDAPLFYRLHPFHLLIDSECKVVQAGAALSRVVPGLVVGADFRQLFDVTMPYTDTSYASLSALEGNSTVMRARGKSSLQLKGQWVRTHVRRADLARVQRGSVGGDGPHSPVPPSTKNPLLGSGSWDTTTFRKVSAANCSNAQGSSSGSVHAHAHAHVTGTPAAPIPIPSPAAAAGCPAHAHPPSPPSRPGLTPSQSLRSAPQLLLPLPSPPITPKSQAHTHLLSSSPSGRNSGSLLSQVTSRTASITGAASGPAAAPGRANGIANGATSRHGPSRRSSAMDFAAASPMLPLPVLDAGDAPVEVLLFVGSPRVTTLDELLRAGLYLEDIPLHDMSSDFVVLAEQRGLEAAAKERLEVGVRGR